MFVPINKIILCFFIISIFFISCKSTADSKKEIKNLYPHLAKYIDKVYSMNEKERKGLLLMVGIKDKILSEETIKILKENKISGIILFDYNIANENQLKKLTSNLREYVSPNILIAIDEEGGKVNRIHFDKLKNISPKNIGDKNDKEYAYKIAYQKSKFLLDLGINMILGPICDIPNNSNSYLYERSFSTNINIVADMVEATVKAQRDAGIITVLKHFPGHGDTSVNSHDGFPIIDKKISELKNKEFVPFKRGIDAGAEIILTAHIKNKYIDDKLPASLSKNYIDILEKELNFNGITITDDLTMTGKIEKGINFGINLNSNIYQNIEYMFEDLNPNIISCAKVLKIISENK
ncbi:glycoside hydrolase family 3 N-terminal domain-containing protein [Brachyspira sp.]|uniref:glycoside hydrolase family 3 N-terminal domain-containing protein n=1 Tax=Brachyspira sp. TaxID=1977261 RepID=UPI003D7CE2DB